MSNVTEKNQAKVIQARLKELGFDVKLGHAYEVLAALGGEKSWNVSKAKLNVLDKLDPKVILIDRDGSKLYEIRIEANILSKMYLTSYANSMEEAHSKVMKALYKDNSFNEIVTNPESWKPIYVEDALPTLVSLQQKKTPVITEISGGKEFSGHHEDGIPQSYFAENKATVLKDVEDSTWVTNRLIQDCTNWLDTASEVSSIPESLKKRGMFLIASTKIFPNEEFAIDLGARILAIINKKST